MMRVMLLVNNWVGWRVTNYLMQTDAEIIGLAYHDTKPAKYLDEIIMALSDANYLIFRGSELGKQRTIHNIAELKPDLCFSIFFDYLLKPDFIELFPKGVINLHPSYLPYNRGNYPNVWSIVDETPAGASLHYIEEGIDTGDIIAQQEVSIEPSDTGESLYWKLEETSVRLFTDTWPLIFNEALKPEPQNINNGSYHRKNDVNNIDCIDLDRNYNARELINIIRARTFPPHKGAYFIDKGRKVFVSINLEYGKGITDE